MKWVCSGLWELREGGDYGRVVPQVLPEGAGLEQDLEDKEGSEEAEQPWGLAPGNS